MTKLFFRWILTSFAFALVLACNAPFGSVTQTVLTQTVLSVTVVPKTSSSHVASTRTPPAVRITPSPSPTPLSPPKAYFKVAVVVDTTTEQVSHDQAQSVVNEASNILNRLTGFGVEMTDYRQDNQGGFSSAIFARYVSSQTGNLPDGLIIFSDGDQNLAKTTGGYSMAIQGPAGFHNSFDSPVYGNGRIYIAVISYTSKYGRCGYGGKDTVQSKTALAGECRNQAGTACVMHNGYSMCASLVKDLYASTPTYFTSANIVHEFMHSFSSGGDNDHYGTPQCDAKMGWPSGSIDPVQVGLYNAICPFVYDNFKNSYHP